MWPGWRGVPDFSEPFCRKCGCDLRGLNWTAPARIILEPDPEFAEDLLTVDRIWGKPIVIENVKLERYDLEEEVLPATQSAGP